MGAAFQTHQSLKSESTIPSFGLSKDQSSQLEPQSSNTSKYPPLNPLVGSSISDPRFKNHLTDPSILPEITTSISVNVASSSAASGQNIPAYWPGSAYGYNSGRTSHSSNMADNMSPYGQLSPFATSGSASTHITAQSQQTQGADQSQDSHQSQPGLVSQSQQSGHSLAATHSLMNGQTSPGSSVSPTVPQTQAGLDPYGQRLRYIGMHPPTMSQQQTTFPSYHNPSLSMHPASGAPRMTVAPTQVPLGGGQQQLPQFSRPYPSYSLPAMNGPVMSNIHQPGNQMALVGNMQSNLVPEFNSGHAAASILHPMYSGHPSSNPHHMHGVVSTGQPNDRPFRCETCTQSFNRNHDLKRHVRIHLAVKPYPCHHCDKSFSRKDALKRHIIVKGCGKGRQSENDNTGSGQSTSSTMLSAPKYSRDDDFGGDRGTPSSGQDSRKGSSAGL